MKVRLISDIHNETGSFNIPSHPDDKNTVLLLAGDIATGKHAGKYPISLSDRFKAIIYVLGNHDYWGGSLVRTPQKAEQRALACKADNVHLLQGNYIEIDDIVFIGATLWTNFDNHNPISMYDAQTWIKDFAKIRTGPNSTPYQRKIQTSDLSAEHHTQKTKILDLIRKHKASGKTVVVMTHHLPSFGLIPDEYKTQSVANLNGAYAVELFEDIAETQPDFWVFGHTHSSVHKKMADTHFHCNPRGYAKYENREFDPQFSFIATRKL